jgi:hypothetical protein
LLKDKKPKITYQQDFEKGGYLSMVLFTRRIRNVMNIILYTFYFYHNEEQSQGEIVKKIIDAVVKFNAELDTSIIVEKSKRFNFILQIVSPIIIPLITVVVTSKYLNQIADYFFYLINYVASTFSNALNAQQIIIISLVGYFTGYFVVFLYQKYFSHQINWYQKIIRQNSIRIKEENILASLETLQLDITRKLYYRREGVKFE